MEQKGFTIRSKFYCREEENTVLRYSMFEDDSKLPLDEKRLFGVSNPPIVRFHCGMCGKDYPSQFICWDDDGQPLCPKNHRVKKI